MGKRTLTREQKVWVKERDSYQCVLCGSKKDLHIHHVVGHRVLNLAVEHVENPCLLVTVCKRDHVGPNQSGKDENCIHPDMAWALRRYHKDNGAIARVFAWRNDKIAGKVNKPLWNHSYDQQLMQHAIYETIRYLRVKPWPKDK